MPQKLRTSVKVIYDQRTRVLFDLKASSDLLHTDRNNQVHRITLPCSLVSSARMYGSYPSEIAPSCNNVEVKTLQYSNSSRPACMRTGTSLVSTGEYFAPFVVVAGSMECRLCFSSVVFDAVQHLPSDKYSDLSSRSKLSSLLL